MSDDNQNSNPSGVVKTAFGVFKGEMKEEVKVGKKQQFKLHRPTIIFKGMQILVTSQDRRFKTQIPMTDEMASLFGSDTFIYLEGIPTTEGLHIIQFLDNQGW